ncbi:MAG: DUF3253 domain-containing protein [Pseudomonadota bacterium]
MTETINDNLSETDSPAASVDPIATAILDALNADEPGAALDPQVIARRIAESRAKKFDPPDLWRRYLPAVRHQALFLARRGQIVILRKGKAADPNAPIKGLIKLTLPGA